MRLVSSVVLALSSLQAVQGMYGKDSNVLQVTGKTYDKIVAKSNYTSIVEFYAPWCGHCQNLKPVYEKVARNLDGLAQVVAVDCDDDSNKSFCGSMGVQGFPTLKIVKPGKKPGSRPAVEEYQGARTATGIVDAVLAKVNNHVVKVTDDSVDAFLGESDGPRALLFSDKGSASALLKGLAIEFLGVVPVGHVRSKESKTVERYGVVRFPTLVLLLPQEGGEGLKPVVYEGETKRAAMVEFLSQAGTPNSKRKATDGQGTNGGTSNAKSKKKAGGGSSSSSSSSSSSKDDDPSAEKATTTTAPVVLDVPPITTLDTEEKLNRECLSTKSHMCVLVFLPEGQSAKAHKALETLARSAHRHSQGQHQFLPFYAVPKANSGAASVLRTLELAGEVEILAVNARRGWWRQYDGDFGTTSVEGWIDSIRMGEGVKSRLPEGFAKAPASDGEKQEEHVEL